jgi:hypothetical protein
MTKTREKRNINLADELRMGHHHGVFIDDTGSPGLSTPGLRGQRKTWVAVLVPPHLVADLMDQLPDALSVLSELGLKDPEFHFTDIWAGKGEYKKLDLHQRLAIFRTMSEIFVTCQLKVFVQTFDPDDAAVLRKQADWLPKNLDPLKFSDHEDLALFFLLSRVHNYLKEVDATACVVVDEGRLKSGSAIIWQSLAPPFHAGGILFASSRLVPLIQLADFAAYVLNRVQLLRVKKTLSELDKTLLRIVSPTTKCFINISSVEIQNLSTITSLPQGMIH